MIKKFLAIILTLILLTESAALAEDCRAEIQFIIHEKDTETAATAEMLIRKDVILITSGLFPSYALSLSGDNSGMPGINETASRFDPFVLPEIPPVLDEMIRYLNPETTAGFFSGDLFENASECMKGTIGPEKLTAILSGSEMSGTDSGTDDSETLAGEILSVPGIAELSGISIQYNLFDHGKYLILNGLEDDRTLFTLSFDFNDPAAMRAVLGYADEGSNYFRDYRLSVLSENDVHFTSALIADHRKRGYRGVMNSTPIVTENWDLHLSEDRKDISFTGEILPANEKMPMDVSGYLTLTERPELQAKISFRNWDESYFTFSVRLDESQMTTEGLKILNPADLSDSTETEALWNEITVNTIPLMMKLMTAVPDDYSDIMLLTD